MGKKLLLGAIAMTVAVALAAGGGPWQGNEPGTLKGKAAPAWKVGKWLNTGGKPLSLASLRGKVVLLDFWTYW